MNLRKVNHFIVLVISILFAELLAKYIEHLIEVGKSANPYLSVLKTMVFTVAVYYPILLISEKVSEKIAHEAFSNTKRIAGGSLGGLIIAGLLCFGLIFVLYFKVLIGRWPF